MECDECKRGNDHICSRVVFTYNSKYEDGEKSYGGYAEAIRVHEMFVFAIPENIPSEFAAPLLCAGITVFSPLKRAAVKDKVVGVLGIGGLGHLALRFLKHMECSEVYVLSHSESKRTECSEYGKFINLSQDGHLLERKVFLLVLTQD
jgi:alcohol dehydrogenase (NADP+)